MLPSTTRSAPNTTPLLLTLGLGVFAGALDLGVLAPALPAIGQTFSVPTGDLAWVFSTYLLVNVASIAIASTLADRYGRRRIYVASVALFALGSVLAVVAPSYLVFLLARGIQAFGAGGIFPVATAAIADAVPKERRGAALGLVAATWGLAAVIGPSLGGLIVHFVSWRWIFIANFPLSAVVIWLAMRYVPQRAPNERGPLDVVGLVLLVAGLLAVAQGVITLYATVVIAGLAVLGLFAAWERNCEFPLIPLKLFSTPQLAKTYGLEIAIGMLEGSLFFVPAVLVAAQGLSYAAAGFIAALGALVFVAVIPLSGRALDRVGSRDVLLVGAVLTEIGLATFALGFTSLPLSILAMIVAGLGFGSLLGAPTRYIVANETTETTRATAVGLLSQCLIIGQILGSSLAGGMMGSGATENAGYRQAYLAFCAIAFVALAIATTLKPRREERRAPLDVAA